MGKGWLPDLGRDLPKGREGYDKIEEFNYKPWYERRDEAENLVRESGEGGHTVDGYYYLKEGDDIKWGDECQAINELDWITVKRNIIGKIANSPLYISNNAYRRKVK